MPLSLHSWSVWCAWFRWAVGWMQWPPGLHRRPLTSLHLGVTLSACYGYSKLVQILTDRYNIRCTLTTHDCTPRKITHLLNRFTRIFLVHISWRHACKRLLTMLQGEGHIKTPSDLYRQWDCAIEKNRAVWEIELRLIPSRRITLKWGHNPCSVCLPHFLRVHLSSDCYARLFHFVYFHAQTSCTGAIFNAPLHHCKKSD